jgi:hypothetical protein
VKNAITKFRAEFETLVREGRKSPEPALAGSH